MSILSNMLSLVTLDELPFGASYTVSSPTGYASSVSTTLSSATSLDLNINCILDSNDPRELQDASRV